MTEGRRGIGHWLGERAYLPRWVVLILFLATAFNVIIFIAIVLVFLEPEAIPNLHVTSDVLLALHIQIFETFLAALAIGLAVFGVIGYAAIREAAERRAEETAKEAMQGLQELMRPPQETGTEKPDLAGLPTTAAPSSRQPEGRI